MLFNSIAFIIYFLPVAIAGYYVLKFSRTAQNVWLLVMSLVFYAWGDPIYVLALVLSIILNYLLLQAIAGARENRRLSHRLAVFTCVLNAVLLAVFKQLPQIVGSVEYFLKTEASFLPDIIIPIGLSFFTLRAISLAVDVYKGAAEPKNPINTALYFMFFPTVIAGPVLRYSDIENQLKNRHESLAGFSSGICKFITGLAKKVLIANSMVVISDHVFSYSAMSNEITHVPSSLAIIGAVAFTLMIYYDLSGYSDMAIGLGRVFGFEMEENFDYPFAALSLNDFWSRWNISLVGWFREYIYYPLGGSLVKNNDKMVRNIFVLWLFIGMWHGASWTFLFWGVWQFFFLVFERVTNYERRNTKKVLRHIYVIIVAVFGFIVFRTDDIYQATLYFSNMLGLNHNGFFSATALMLLREYWHMFAAGILFLSPVAKKLSVAAGSIRGRSGVVLSAVYPVVMLALFMVTMSYIFRGGGYPFIYFRF